MHWLRDCRDKTLGLGLFSVAGDVLNGEGTCESEGEQTLVIEDGKRYGL